MSEHCGHCKKVKLTIPGLRRHITQSPTCCRALSAQVTRRLDAMGTDNPVVEWDPSSNSRGSDLHADEEYAVPEVNDMAVNPNMAQEDIEAGGLLKKPWVGNYPDGVASIVGKGKTMFETLLLETNRAAGVSNFTPFEDREEWELASWLVSSGLSQEAIEEYLTLPITCGHTQPSFKNKYTFLKKLDQLPAGPEWTCDEWDIIGEVLNENGDKKTKPVELWCRNPVECIRELLGNPKFKEHLHYAPKKLFWDANGTDHIYSEMWTGDWWWDTQGVLPSGATIAPVILSSDKTQLSRFSGDKQAWPVYMSIGNLSKDIPVTKLECFPKGKRCSLEGYRLFHECMRAILEPLIAAGKEGIDILCADGKIRHVHPILAAYVADHPEQCLIAACQENFCPKCTVHATHLGDPLSSVMKEHDFVWEIIKVRAGGDKKEEFKELGLRLIDPFWWHLPHCDIFLCITPNLLHQLHKGVFKDHTVSWTTDCLEGGADELDRHFKAMPSHPALQHFKKGILLVTQWTGTEYKHMEKVFVGAILGTCSAEVARAVQAVLDFIFYAHFEAHSDHSLAHLEAAWAAFHQYKYVFKEEKVCEDFNVPKLHSAGRYATSIRKLGTTDGYNTEASERLHIDYVKRSYAASNKRTYIKQMTIWLNHQEAVSHFRSFLNYAEPLVASSPIPSYAPEDDGDIEMAYGSDEEVDKPPPYIVAKTPGLPEHIEKPNPTRYGPICASRLSLCSVQANECLPPPMRQVSQQYIKDTVRAVLAQPSRPMLPGSPAHFDMVLAHEIPAFEDPNNPLHGLTIARVRAIFRLPEAYGPHFKHPVAYVEWFTPFRQPDPETGMFKVSYSTQMHRRNASIIRT
ncbi:hypothetical protein C8Q74DRAFT_1370751 [Fomes fomentarius]|nr:hypothetical protein C8Q74DRAFT_1370751 [Fomes fomentarius]